MPKLFIIAGCNGAGKTTASYTILPEILNCQEFVNANEIAKGLSPFNPDSVAIEAGRIMLNRIRELIRNKIDFAFETTLATRSYIGLIKQAKVYGYQVTLLYFWLSSPELAIERVNERVKEGGHNIIEETVRRRYERGINNLFNLYIFVCDYWILINNSTTPSALIAEGEGGEIKQIYDHSTYNTLGHERK